MSISYINASPIYPNKWNFYVEPFYFGQTSNKLIFEFNWFICAKPTVDVHKNKVIEVGHYSLFFDKSTGKTYKLKSESKSCTLKLLEDREFNEKNAKKSIKDGYDGIAIKKSNTSMRCELVCSNAELMFNRDVLELSDRCPYIEHAKTHISFLQSNIKTFPHDENLRKMKPGDDSLTLRRLMLNYC